MPKGQYDRSTSAWVPPPKRVYPPELVEQVRELYGAGHTMKEVAALAGVSVKVLQTLMPRHGIARRPAIPRNQRGPANAGWKGDAAGYKALHLRVDAARGKPRACECCGLTDPKARYEWANLTGRYEDTADYQRLCVPCHRTLDARRRTEMGGRTSPLR